MGTSKSFGGPRGKTALLPDWATNLTSGSQEVNQNANDGNENESNTLADGVAPPPVKANTGSSNIANVQAWSNAKSSLTRAAKSYGKPAFAGRLRKAGKQYVVARGGSKKAAQNSHAAVRATANFAGFLSAVSQQGSRALAFFGLGRLVGQEPAEVITELCDIFAPGSDTREDVIARQAILEALEDVLEIILAASEDGSEVVITETDLKHALHSAIAAYVYRRWLSDLGKRIEKLSISPREALSLELEMKNFIKESVILEFKDKDILKVDWKGSEGSNFIEELYNQAFAILETE